MSLFRPNVCTLKAKRDIPRLIKALEYRRDASVKEEAKDALVEIGKILPHEILCSMFPSMFPLFRHVPSGQQSDAYIEILREMGEPVVGWLIKKLRNQRSEIRVWAAEILIKIIKPEAEKALVDFLIEVLRSGVEDSIHRKLAGEVLVNTTESAVEKLKEVIRHSDTHTMLWAEKLLNLIDREAAARQASPLLFTRLRSDCRPGEVGERLATEAVQILAARGEPGAKVLAMCLDSSYGWRIRDAAIRALEEMGEPAVKPLIVKVIRGKWGNTLHDEYDEGNYASGILRDIGKPAVGHLVATLKEKKWGVEHSMRRPVRFRLTHLLESITGEDFGEDDKKWQAWWERNKEAFINSAKDSDC